MRIILALGALVAMTPVVAGVARADEVGGFKNDWTGNRIVVEAIADPKVQGITCHLTHFDRSVIDRLRKGNWFEDPSNSSIACRQTGPLAIGDIKLDEAGEEVFSERASLVFKSIAVRRIYDKKNDTLIYVAYSRQVQDASAKMSVTTVPLYGTGANWTGRKP